MNPRERILAMAIVVAVILAGGGFMFYHFYLNPLQERQVAIDLLNSELADKEGKIRQVLAERPKLERWRLLSLPSDIDLASVEYQQYLEQKLFQKSGFTSFTILPKSPEVRTSSALPGKAAVYTRLQYVVIAHGNLDNLVQMMEEFYNTSLLQQIKQLNIQRPLTVAPQQKPDDLDITMTIEAVNVAGAGSRNYLLPNVPPRLVVSDIVAAMRGIPPGIALAAWAASPAGPNGPGILADPARQYSAIVAKNIFFGQGDTDVVKGVKDVTRYVRLVSITLNERRSEAWLYDQLNNRPTRLRSEPGFDSFRVMDESGGTVVRGKVVRIEPRDIVFQADDKYYNLHVGQNVEEAMKQSISSERLRSLGLVAAPQSKDGAQ